MAKRRNVSAFQSQLRRCKGNLRLRTQYGVLREVFGKKKAVAVLAKKYNYTKAQMRACVRVRRSK